MLNKNYYIRENYLKNNEIPMRKEIRQSLKYHMTNAYFSQLDKDTKILVGLDPVLKGPGEQLWVYPMDELIDNVVLKPVTTKEIQALTHTAILEYGDNELDEIERDKQTRVERAVLDNNEIWWHFTKAHTKGCVKEAVRKERDIQNRDILALCSTFNHIYKNGLEEAQTKFNRQTEILVTELRDVMRKKNCCEQDRRKIEEVEARMGEECTNRLGEELSRQGEHFEAVLMMEHARFSHELKERTRILRHELECRGIVDILYMACIEKHFYNMRQLERDEAHHRELEEERRLRQDLMCDVMELTRRLKHRDQENARLKENMRSLCKEFKRLFSCHTNLPFQQLGFLPEFEKIFIDSVYSDLDQADGGTSKQSSMQGGDTSKDTSGGTQGDSGGSVKGQREGKHLHTGPDISESVYLPGSSSTTESQSKAAKGSNKVTLKSDLFFPQEIIFAMYKRQSSVQSSQSSKISLVINAIIEQARRGLRTSILKTKKDSEEVEADRRQNKESYDKGTSTSLHRDSLTLLKEKKLSSSKFTDFVHTCPEAGCQFSTIMEYDFPPHVAHLALMNYDQAVSLEYDDYENCTVEQLKQLTDIFCGASYDNAQPDREESKEDTVHERSSSFKCSARTSKRSTPKGSKKGSKVNMEQIRDAALKETCKSNENNFVTECPTEVTKEIIQQIFIDHPSLTECVLDQ